jgi:hypothetical protein
MISLLRKYTTLILILLLPALFVLAWLFPSARSGLGMVFLLASFLIASLATIQKHRETWLKGRITRGILLRNVSLEITGTALAMLLAGSLGRAVAGLVMEQVDGDLTRLVAGLLAGLSMGMVVGIFVNKTWGRLVTTPPAADK